MATKSAKKHSPWRHRIRELGIGTIIMQSFEDGEEVFRRPNGRRLHRPTAQGMIRDGALFPQGDGLLAIGGSSQTYRVVDGEAA